MALRASRERAMEEFHRASSAHVDQITRLQASVAEQSALVAELEEALAVAEKRAAVAIADAATLRRGAKDLEEADRTRRSRLAELEGKLLRLEYEKKAAPPATPATEELERKLQAVETERETLRAERDRLRGQLAGAESAVAALEVELAGARQPHATNGKETAPPAADLPDRALEELAGIEKELRREMETIAQLEARIDTEFPDAVRPSGDNGPEVVILHTTLTNFRRRAARLRDEIEGCRRRMESLSTAELSGFLEELGEDLAEFAK
jgi:chromosome segregation ATPase